MTDILSKQNTDNLLAKEENQLDWTEVLEKLKLDEVKLIPANIPPHRPTPFASPADRKKMIKLAISDEKKLSIDLREIENGNISYTVNTLKSLRDEFSNDIILLK